MNQNLNQNKNKSETLENAGTVDLNMILVTGRNVPHGKRNARDAMD